MRRESAAYDGTRRHSMDLLRNDPASFGSFWLKPLFWKTAVTFYCVALPYRLDSHHIFCGFRKPTISPEKHRWINMHSCCHGPSHSDLLWQAADVNMTALETIISSHFSAQWTRCTSMDNGSYGRVFLFSLENELQVVGHVVLPVRESVKTEAEVAAMKLVRGTYWCLILVLLWFKSNLLVHFIFSSPHVYSCSESPPLL